jgi:hypothetical protein
MTAFLLRLKRFCGFIVGIVFFMSGIVKLMDPVGAGLVMDEYYSFMHLDFMSFSSKVMGTLFALAEALIGAALVTGVWKSIIAKVAVGLQGFFTLLTLVLVIFNPEMDCGCFGEAIHLTHMQTFLKNLVLLALLLAYMLPLKHLMIDTKKRKYVVFYLVGISTLAFTIYSWIYIPMVDFTAYKPGAELSAGADINPEDMYESVFTYEKDGVQETFTLEDLPQDIDTWTFVSTETRTKNDQVKDLIELSFYKAETGEYMDTLATDGKVMIVSVYDTDMRKSRWGEVESFIRRSQEKGFTTLLLCAKEDGIPEKMKDFAYISDYKTLISMNRSNGGVTYFNDGVLIRKWARICAPDQAELDELQKTDTTEVSIARESKGSLVFQGFLLYVFAVMLLL